MFLEKDVRVSAERRKCLYKNTYVFLQKHDGVLKD